MAKRQLHKTHIRAWRKYRGLSLRELAARMEKEPGVELVSYASLGRIENGKQPYNQEILEALADALSVTVGMLLEWHPEREGKVLELYNRMNERTRAQADALLETLAKTGT